ncbi:hypothetical protein [Natronomonas marina]|jgi:hypothetical protein|uniref:hypothetical protein n=1 Tax=Natronomonas marina TaxID=2961939 RepID=UPI0020CA073F|nr:hypothetical protein [Natronomonas marina]
MSLLASIDLALLVQVSADPAPSAGRPLVNLLGSAVGAFLTTLVVGAILIAVAEEYTLGKMATVVEEPLGSFLYGLICLVFLGLVILVLVITELQGESPRF